MLVVLAYIAYILLFGQMTQTKGVIDTTTSQMQRDAEWAMERAREYADLEEQRLEIVEMQSVIRSELDFGEQQIYSGYAQIMGHINLILTSTWDIQ